MRFYKRATSVILATVLLASVFALVSRHRHFVQPLGATDFEPDASASDERSANMAPRTAASLPGTTVSLPGTTAALPPTTMSAPPHTQEDFQQRVSHGEYSNCSRSLPASLAPVPRVHFMYRTHTVREVFAKYLLSWRAAYPDYELYFWTDSDLARFESTLEPHLRQLYQRLKNPLMRSDLIRLALLHSFGGWYSDLDVMCLRRADSYVRNRTIVLPLEPTVHSVVLFHRPWLVNNAVMYSQPGHPFLAMAMDFLVHKLNSKIPAYAVYATGPVAVTTAVELCQKASHNCCLPSLPREELFNPLFDNTTWMRTQFRGICSRAGVGNDTELDVQCRRQRLQNFTNWDTGSTAYTYHGFLHLTENQSLMKPSPMVDVRRLGVNFTCVGVLLGDSGC